LNQDKTNASGTQVCLHEKRQGKDMDGRMYALRRGRVSEAGYVYSITTVTHDRQALFEDLTMARTVVGGLKWADEQRWVRSLAYCLMPDHLHWVFRLGRRRTLSAVIQTVKGYSAMTINRIRQTPGQPIWQEGFHDHTIRVGSDLRHLARYVVANPLRAGLVEDLGRYPHWDAVWLETRGAAEDVMS
jgi:putative transposase